MSTFVEVEEDTLKSHKTTLPETRTGEEGSAKRNIIRRNSKPKGGSGAGGTKGARNILDDGSTYYDPGALDNHDPNYDSEEETGKEYIPQASPKRFNYNPEVRRSVPQAPMTLTAYKRKIEEAIEELFRSGDLEEVETFVLELNCNQYAYELVKRAISMSLDRTDKEREMISKLISYSYPDILSTNSIGKGFERLFEIADELEKDVPAAREYIAIFLARAVVDEVLPPAFLNDVVVCDLGGEIVERAKTKLSREHGHTILEKGWGPGDGRPVDQLKVAVDLLMNEYLLSNDKVEANRCIRELNAEQFHHEIVKRGVTVALDKSEVEQLAMSSLFEYIRVEDTVSTQQFVKGFNRLHAILSDLKLDIPSAPVLLEGFVQRAKASNVLPADYVANTQNGH